MKVIAYLGFTLLSIVIQFCLMDLTKEKIDSKDGRLLLNTSSQKARFEDLLKTFTQKPHALYYRTQVNSKVKEQHVTSPTKTNDNSDKDSETTTISNTIIDELYDENSTTTEETFTTESLDTSSEFDNVTEISLFEKKNQSTLKPGITKKFENKNCICNLLYEVCDINCCCDSDCSESQKNLFLNCKDVRRKNEDTHELCYPYQHFSRGEQSNIIDSLFCIAKINLPEKRKVTQKQYDIAAINSSYKWHILGNPKHTEFERKPYEYGEPVWVLKEGSIWYIDMPSPAINNYCSVRKPILFLHNTNVKCIVNIKELEMFQILKTSKEAPCISVTEKSLNSTALNCSTLYCTNWTIFACQDTCVDYNNSIHEPSCTEKYCTNLAHKLEYIFYYYDSKIYNATIKLYTRNVPTYIPYVTQEISVKFLLTNKSIAKVTEISGNPGYLYGRPVIISLAESNRSLIFFNTTSVANKYLLHPNVENRLCTFIGTDPQFILFGSNKRLKCRFLYNKNVRSENSTNVCSEIERHIEQWLGITKKTYVCPYGNPLDVKDSKWITIQNNLYDKEVTYGNFLHKKSKIRCYNMVTRIAYMFTFADVSEVTSRKVYKIVSANTSVTTQNITFDTDDVSAVLTMDINFIDGTKPRTFEFAAGPYINVQLPRDFFFPFRSKGWSASGHRGAILASIVSCVIIK